MFDGISPNDRIFGSRFDQARIYMPAAASGVRASMQEMEARATSSALKTFFHHKTSLRLEVASNIHPNFAGVNVRRYGPQPSIFVRSFSPITNIRAIRTTNVSSHESASRATSFSGLGWILRPSSLPIFGKGA